MGGGDLKKKKSLFPCFIKKNSLKSIKEFAFLFGFIHKVQRIPISVTCSFYYLVWIYSFTMSSEENSIFNSISVWQTLWTEKQRDIQKKVYWSLLKYYSNPLKITGLFTYEFTLLLAKDQIICAFFQESKYCSLVFG